MNVKIHMNDLIQETVQIIIHFHYIEYVTVVYISLQLLFCQAVGMYERKAFTSDHNPAMAR